MCALSLKAPAPRKGYPDFSFEDGIGGIVCGLDEVGRGPLAGPVVAACVIIPSHLRELSFISEIRDSKKLSSRKLEQLSAQIIETLPHTIAEISPAEIDRINILQASLQAMALACRKIGAVDHALVDGNKAPALLPCPATTVIKGDSRSVTIAAASIIAKVYRDRLMERLSAEFPHYGWERNAGYPTADHLAAITRHGITPHHRQSFGPVRRFIEDSGS